MRNFVLSAVCAAAFALPGAAWAQSGHIDLSAGNQTYDFGGIEIDADTVGVGGQVAFSGLPVGLQVDAHYANWDSGGGDIDVGGVGAHVFVRNDAWLIGGYAGYDDADQWNYETWTGALEGQLYLPRATLSGVLSYSEIDIAAAYSITMLEAEYRHFVTDNLSIHGGLGIGQGEIGTSDPDAWSGEIGAEYQFEAAPISVFGLYRHNNLDFGTGELDVDALSVGVRYNWGGTLMERNRRGAGLNRVLPIFHRFVS